jgi:hypothetical protein
MNILLPLRSRLIIHQRTIKGLLFHLLLLLAFNSILFISCKNSSSGSTTLKADTTLAVTTSAEPPVVNNETGNRDITEKADNSGVAATIDTTNASGSDFKAYTGSFTVGKFPFNVNETPLLADGDLPQNFHQISMENIRKYINPEATEDRGYLTGYAIFEKEFIALITFYNYSSMYRGDNYHTSVDLQTYTPDGTLISKISLGEIYTMVNSSAQRESREIDGFVKTDTISVIHYKTFLEDKPTESGKPLLFIIKPDGKIDEKKAGD